MIGYYNLPDLTAKAIDPDGWFHTGDMARFDEDGHLAITGRIKEMLIIGGENVFPREIEEVINRHPAIKDSAIIGKPDPMRGEVPIAFVEIEPDTLDPGTDFDPQEVLTLCREHLAGYKVPKQVRPIDTLPRSGTGKIIRRELVKLL